MLEQIIFLALKVIIINHHSLSNAVEQMSHHLGASPEKLRGYSAYAMKLIFIKLDMVGFSVQVSMQ